MSTKTQRRPPHSVGRWKKTSKQLRENIWSKWGKAKNWIVNGSGHGSYIFSNFYVKCGLKKTAEREIQTLTRTGKMWIISSSDAFLWSLRGQKASLNNIGRKIHFSPNPENFIFNSLMTKTNWFAAPGRDMSQMCKTDSISWTLHRDANPSFKKTLKSSYNNTRKSFWHKALPCCLDV